MAFVTRGQIERIAAAQCFFNVGEVVVKAIAAASKQQICCSAG
jgi:hypothetical protein